MTQAQQPEALRLADLFDQFAKTFGEHPSGSRTCAAVELRRQHARILELEQCKCLHQIAEPAEPSATYGMHFGDRVLHIGGRENAEGYIEFGSVEAVRVLVGQVLRDLPGGAPGFELAVTHPAVQGMLDAMTNAFITSESDGAAGSYKLVAKFQTLPELQAAHNALVTALAAQAKQGGA